MRARRRSAPVSPAIGWEHVLPTKEQRYFARPTRGGRPVAICVPCCNEDRKEVEMTIGSLAMQEIPPGFYLDIVILADGLLPMAASMREYLSEQFGLDWNNLPPQQTIIVDRPADVSVTMQPNALTDAKYFGQTCPHSAPISVSLLLKRVNQRKANSHHWFFGAHARDIEADYAFTTDCGTIFDHRCLGLLVRTECHRI